MSRYEIVTRSCDQDEWTSQPIGVENAFPTEDDANAAIDALIAMGGDWAQGQYAVREIESRDVLRHTIRDLDNIPVTLIPPRDGAEIISITPTTCAPMATDVVRLYLSLDTETGEATIRERTALQQGSHEITQREHDGRDVRIYLPSLVLVSEVRSALEGLTVSNLIGDPDDDYSEPVDWTDREDLAGGWGAWPAGEWLLGSTRPDELAQDMEITKETTDERLTEIARRIVTDAAGERIYLVSDQVKDVLTQVWDELRDGPEVDESAAHDLADAGEEQAAGRQLDRE